MSSQPTVPPAATDQDAMRVMVAAVIAQQATIDEREAALAAREQAVAEQERQLAERLADKQQQLESLHEQLALARDQFRQERAQQSATLDEAAKIHAEAVAERNRLHQLKARFLQRWKRHWSEEEFAWQQKQTGLEARSADLERELESARQIRNRIDAESKNLKAEQTAWQNETARQTNDMALLRESISQKQHALLDAEHRLHNEKMRLEQECEALRSEARGLENRVSHGRRLLIAQELAHTAVVKPAIDGIPESPSALPLPPAIEEALAEREEYQRRCQAALQKQAATLADQRSHLAEMCERLAQAESEWQAKQIAAVAEMERLANDLQQREDSFLERTRLIDADAQRSRQEREQLASWRKDLEQAAADLALRQSAQRGEWDRLRAELSDRERLAQRREKALSELLERWRKRRRAEADRLRKLANESIAAREHYVRSRNECHDRAESLREAQQALTEQALALEEARQEFLNESDRPGQVAKRFERLHRRWERRNAAAKRELTRVRDSLAAEDAELRQIYQELQTERAELVAGQQELAQQVTEVENLRRRAVEISDRFESARSAWLEQRRSYELQLTDLRAEIARLQGPGESPRRAAA